MNHESLLANAMCSIANPIFITDRDSRIVWANRAFFLASGFSADDLLGNSPAILKSGKQESDFYRDLWQTVIAGRVWQGEAIERKKDGTLYNVEETISPLFDNAGNISHFVVVQQTIASQEQDRGLDHFLAYHDCLTGLPNRTYFLKILKQSIDHARQQHKCLALLFIDLDRFKPINDKLGHRTGDLLLKAVAQRLRGAVRKTDTVARIGGDEFTVIESGLGDEKPARTLAREVAREIGRPYMIDSHKIEIGASVGIAIFPDDGDSPEMLLDKADVAMYREKKQGRHHYAA